MLENFANFIPGRWFDEAGMTKSGHAQDTFRARHEKRWTHFAKSMSFAAGTALAIGSFAVADLASASNLKELAAPPGLSPVSSAADPLATPGQVNESFNELFAAFRDGVNLITNDNTRRLAEKAAAHRDDRPKGWARKLASDTEDASD